MYAENKKNSSNEIVPSQPKSQLYDNMGDPTWMFRCLCQMLKTLGIFRTEPYPDKVKTLLTVLL